MSSQFDQKISENPIELSFEQAIAETQALLDQQNNHSISDQVFTEQISNLLESENGARGFFVTFLTGEWQIADQDHPSLSQALKAQPQPELLIKNLVMSTAMRIYHDRAGNSELATGSARVSRRTAQLINHVITPELLAIAKNMSDSAQGNSQIYQEFLRKWGYDPAQKEAIANCLSAYISNPAKV